MAEAITQEIITGVLQGLSDDPQVARNIQAAAGGHYIGGAVPASLVNMGGNLGHSPLIVNQGSFSHPLIGMIAGGYVNNAIDPFRRENADVMYQQNQQQIQQAAWTESVAKNMMDRMEANGFSGAMPFARHMARKVFGGPMDEQMLQLISRFGMDKDPGLAAGMMDTGMSTIGLNQFGLIGSLTKRDELSKLRIAIEQAGASEGLAEALGTATALGDPNLGLNLSKQAIGYRGGENLGKITADLKKAKETLGMGKRQTLSLLGDVYDGIIEDVLPELGEFVDKIAKLESHGIRAPEYAHQVNKARVNLRRLGIIDETAAVNVVDRALAGGNTVNQIYRDSGVENFNIKRFQSERLAAETRIAGSTEARTLGLVLEAMGVDPNDRESVEKVIESGFAGLETIDSGLKNDLNSFGLIGVANRMSRGNYKSVSADVFRNGPGQAYLDAGLGASAFRRGSLKEILDYEGSGVSELPERIKQALLNQDDSAGRFGTYKGLLSMSQLGMAKYQGDGEKDVAARKRFMDEHGLALKGEMVVDTTTGTELSLDFLKRQGGTLSRNLQEAGMLGAMGFGSIENINSDTYALMLRGLSGKAEDRASDLEIAKKHIQQLTKGTGSKTSARSLIGVALDAAMSVSGSGRGERPQGDETTDISTFLNMVKSEYQTVSYLHPGSTEGVVTGMNKEWMEATDYLKEEIRNNPALLSALGGQEALKNAGLEDLGTSLDKLRDKQESILKVSKPGTEEYKDAQVKKFMIDDIVSKMKFGEAAEEDKTHEERVESLLEAMVENTKPENKTESVPDSEKSRTDLLNEALKNIINLGVG